MLKSSPVRVVPPARVDFTAEDRQWIADRIQEVLASGRLTLGTYGEEFERRFADYLGAKHAVAVNCGTSALEIIFRALGVEGRDVLVPANSNYVTVVAVVHAGGRPVLMGTEAETLGTAPEEVERCITPNTAGFPWLLSELAGSALFVVASSQRETERPVRASGDTIRA